MAKTNPKMVDSGIERSVLSGIMTNGIDCFLDIAEFLKPNDFYWIHNQEIYAILTELAQKQDAKTFDFPNMQATAKSMGFTHLHGVGKNVEYLTTIAEVSGATADNTAKLAMCVYKLSLARRAYLTARGICQKLEQTTGSERISEIIESLEEPIFEFTGAVGSHGNSTVKLGDQVDQTIAALTESPKDIAGLPTGFPAWDNLIGGGFRPATVNVLGARAKKGKCVNSFLTTILTSKGILMPYELFSLDGEKKRSDINFRLLDEHGYSQTPDYWWNNGMSDTVEIQTRYGGQLSVTPNHPVRILDKDGCTKWRNAEDLLLGDYLVTRRGDNYWGCGDMLADDAYIIGVLVGDGCINNCIVDMSSRDDVCRDQFKSFISRQSGTIGTETKKALRCNIAAIARKIAGLGFYDNQKHKIFPQCIRTANRQVVCQSLCGYFDADGTVESNGVTATTNSLKLAVQLRAILLNLGILSKTRTRHIIPPGHSKTRPYWEIAIQNVESARMFRDLIGFRIPRKQKALDLFCKRKASTKNDTVPNLAVPLQELKDMIRKDRGYFLPGRRSNLRDAANSWIRGARRARRDVVEKLLVKLVDYAGSKEYKTIERLIDGSLLFDEVSRLSCGEALTSDFYIPDGHSFVTNGIISHNSFACLNIAKNIASNNVPVLYLDTELTNDLQLQRLLSLTSGVELSHVETGQFASNPHETAAIKNCKKQMETMPIYHHSVAGQSSQVILATARRWLTKTVGFMDSGAAKPCLIIYDYIKLMDDSGFKHNLQEFQLLGFLITALHNFAVKYKVPIFATVQLNRDGVEKEGAEVISGSDRIMWLCSNFTILKPKTQQEFDEDPPSNGEKKLVVADTRFGPGMESGEYINVHDNLAVSKMSEGKPFSLIVAENAVK